VDAGLPITGQKPAVPGRPLLFAQSPHRELLLCLLLFGLVWLAFGPAIDNDFIGFDDPDYVTANSHVQHGLSWQNLKWALSTSEAANWHPLTWLSHLLDYQCFGLEAWGHHLTSILLHAANAILLFLVLKRMTGATGRSFLVATLFALHPLRVESVAWVAERKDVLSATFWLLTLWAYARFAESQIQDSSRSKREKIQYYVLALLFSSSA